LVAPEILGFKFRDWDLHELGVKMIYISILGFKPVIVFFHFPIFYKRFLSSVIFKNTCEFLQIKKLKKIKKKDGCFIWDGRLINQKQFSSEYSFVGRVRKGKKSLCRR
jgi:hypothetical protein